MGEKQTFENNLSVKLHQVDMIHYTN